MKITKQWLTKRGACQDGIDWVIAEKLIGLDGNKFVGRLIKADKLDWANWLIVRIMDYKQYVSYAVYAAEQVIDNYEAKYPTDKRPRQAIEAAKKCLKNPSAKNKQAAYSAYWAVRSAYSATCAAYSAVRLAYSATCAAYSATCAAYSAARSAAYAAAYSARSAAYAAACSAYLAADSAMKTKILNYGLELLNR